MLNFGAVPGALQNRVRVTRRPGAESVVNLQKRRMWFDEAGDPPPADPPPGEGDNGGEQEAQNMSELPQWAQDEIKRSRKEAGDYRMRAKAAEEARQKEAAKKLEEQGEWQKLAEQRAAELEAMKSVSEKAEALAAKIQATNEARIKQLPEAYRGMVPDYDDPVKVSEWLDKNAAALQKPQAPNLDGGAQGDAAKNVKLTAEELAAAKRMGISAEKYAAMKAK